ITYNKGNDNMVKFFKYILFVFLCLVGVISIFLSACYIMGPPPIDMEVTTIFYDQSDEALEPMTDQQTLSLDEVPTTILTATFILIMGLILKELYELFGKILKHNH